VERELRDVENPGRAGGRVTPGPPASTGSAIDLAQAEVTVGHARSHLQLLGKRHPLPIPAFCDRRLARLPVRVNVAKASRRWLPSHGPQAATEIERALRVLERVLDPVGLTSLDFHAPSWD
jgi:hypothetical protein